MSINEIIVYLMVLFMALGAIDRILGNRFGLGEKFEEGIMAMGSLALAMIGIICLAPVLAQLLLDEQQLQFLALLTSHICQVLR